MDCISGLCCDGEAIIPPSVEFVLGVNCPVLLFVQKSGRGSDCCSDSGSAIMPQGIGLKSADSVAVTDLQPVRFYNQCADNFEVIWLTPFDVKFL